MSVYVYEQSPSRERWTCNHFGQGSALVKVAAASRAPTSTPARARGRDD